MLIKTRPTAIAIVKDSCTTHCLTDVKRYLLTLKEKGIIDLTINKSYIVVETTNAQLYNILFTLAINYDIELM